MSDLAMDYAPNRGFRLDWRAPRYWARKTIAPPHLRKAIKEVRQVGEALVEHWDELDPQVKQNFRLAFSGENPLEPNLREAVSMVAWSASTVFNLAFFRSATIDYFNEVYEVGKRIRARIAADVWSEVLGSAEIVEGAKRGRAEILAGKTVEYSPPQKAK